MPLAEMFETTAPWILQIVAIRFQNSHVFFQQFLIIVLPRYNLLFPSTNTRVGNDQASTPALWGFQTGCLLNIEEGSRSLVPCSGQ